MKKSWTIRFKLSLILVILAVGLIIYGILSYQTMMKVRIGGNYYNKITTEKDLLQDILPGQLFILRSYLLAYMLLSEQNPHKIEENMTRAAEARDEYENYHNFLKTIDLPHGLKEEAVILANKPAEQFFEIWDQEFIPALLKGNKTLMHEILQQRLRPLYEDHEKHIIKGGELGIKEDKDLEREIEDFFKQTKALMIATWLITTLLGTILTYILSRSIAKELQASADTLNESSQEIKEKTHQQVDTIVQQSSSVQETTAAMDELKASFEHTRALAKEASNHAKNSVQTSHEGNALLKNLLEDLTPHNENVRVISSQMTRLNEFILQIHKFAAVIHSLTSQTNILALNAAIQATRAKEHSEGFSVIAAEIRKLADESKKFLSHIDLLVQNIGKETNEISEIVKQSNSTLHECIHLAQETTKSFDKVISLAHVTLESAEQVSLNINQQASGVGQVLEAMELLTNGTKVASRGMQKINESLNKLDETKAHLTSII
jgi:methyl-accepting chemotaxis protein